MARAYTRPEDARPEVKAAAAKYAGWDRRRLMAERDRRVEARDTLGMLATTYALTLLPLNYARARAVLPMKGGA